MGVRPQEMLWRSNHACKQRSDQNFEEKLEATNDLVRTVSELEKACRNNVDYNQGSQASKDRIGAWKSRRAGCKDGELSVMRRQYFCR
jgi:hypothetical protein